MVWKTSWLEEGGKRRSLGRELVVGKERVGGSWSGVLSEGKEWG